MIVGVNCAAAVVGSCSAGVATTTAAGGIALDVASGNGISPLGDKIELGGAEGTAVTLMTPAWAGCMMAEEMLIGLGMAAESGREPPISCC